MRQLIVLAGVMFSLAFTPAGRPVQLDVAGDAATVEFPDRITFTLKGTSEADVSRVILEYGLVNQLTCGQVVAKAFPGLTAGRNLDVSWTWEMRDSGSQPPGAVVWWQWRIVDSAGKETVTEKKTVTWLDQDRRWLAARGGSINLYWYAGNQSFGQGLHTAAISSLTQLERETGLKPDQPIDLYIYGSNDELRNAVLYEPGWTGGLAYPDYNIAILGIAPDQSAWGKRAQAHELTHVLVGHLTFTCLGVVPTWLDEGLAVYGEGGPDDASLRRLQQAIVSDALMPVRALSAGFSEDPGQANLSYSQSYSLVNFLITKYGRENVIQLLTALHNSATVDAALQQVYGFDIDGFERVWRAAVGAPAHTQVTATPTGRPTLVPTFVPITGVSVAVAPTAPALPTARATAPASIPSAGPTALVTAEAPNTPGAGQGSLLWAGLAVIGVCGVIGLGVGAMFVFAMSRKGGNPS